MSDQFKRLVPTYRPDSVNEDWPKRTNDDLEHIFLSAKLEEAASSPEPTGETPAERIFAWLSENPGWHARADVLTALADISAGDWNQAIRELVEFREVERKGEKRGTRYRASEPGGHSAEVEDFVDAGTRATHRVVVRSENEFGKPEIPNEDLRLDDIPAGDSADWNSICFFALTFDGYSGRSVRDCGSIANAALSEYRKSGRLPDSLTDLRICLFFEQRRWHHFGAYPDDETIIYARTLVGAIRKSVEAGDTL